MLVTYWSGLYQKASTSVSDPGTDRAYAKFGKATVKHMVNEEIKRQQVAKELDAAAERFEKMADSNLLPELKSYYRAKGKSARAAAENKRNEVK